MRKMPAQMGTTRNHRGTQGMPEMQESVLEHSSEEPEENIVRQPNAFLVEYGTGKIKWEGYVPANREEDFFRRSLEGDMGSFDNTAICAPC
jgi:hypothetical protein